MNEKLQPPKKQQHNRETFRHAKNENENVHEKCSIVFLAVV